MNKEIIKKSLIEKHPEVNVINYINYLEKVATEKNKDGSLKNKWFAYKKDNQLIDWFNKFADEGVYIDGDLATIQNIGVSLSYGAYKNLVLKRYPEAKIDLQLVHDGDDFDFSKKDGKVFYTHKINNPFIEKAVIGAYCIIKIKTGDFLELITLKELEKIRKTAKTDYIWKQWTSEMYLKTVIKRACKRHFKDITTNIDNIDNESYDIENPLDIELKIKQEIEEIKTIECLAKYYRSKKDSIEFKKSFNKLINKRKEDIQNENL